MNSVRMDWQDGVKIIPLPENCRIRYLTPKYPPPLSNDELETKIRHDLCGLHSEIRAASKIVLLVEDNSRITDTAFLVEQLVKGMYAIRGSGNGIDIIVAAGAHARISAQDLIRKTGNLAITPNIHNATDIPALEKAGVSQSGIPLIFNRQVAQADLRLSVSTINIHPLLGYSGGGKILLPGVAALETIEAFHALPSGIPGDYHNPMQEMIQEVLKLLPIRFSWQLISRPDGQIVKIFGGTPEKVHPQGISVLKEIATVSDADKPAEIVFAGCRPFNQNLLGTYKSFAQLNRLLKPGGSLVLFNEATNGRGEHYWRNQPDVVRDQKNNAARLFPENPVGIFSPNSDPLPFRELFPEKFRLLRSDGELLSFINQLGSNSHTALVVPFAPITLLAPV